MDYMSLIEILVCSATAITGIGTTGFSLARSAAYKKGQKIADNAKNMWLTRLEEVENDIKHRTEIARQDILASLEDRQKQIESSYEDLRRIKAGILKAGEDLDLKKTEILELEKEIKKKKSALDAEIRASAHQMSTSQISLIRKELQGLRKKFEDLQTEENIDWKHVREFKRTCIPGREKLDALSIRDNIFSWMKPEADYKIYIGLGDATEIIVIHSHDVNVLERKIQFVLSEWKSLGNIYPTAKNTQKRSQYAIVIYSRNKSKFISPAEREENYKSWLMNLQKLEEVIVELSQNIEEKNEK